MKTYIAFQEMPDVVRDCINYRLTARVVYDKGGNILPETDYPTYFMVQKTVTKSFINSAYGCTIKEEIQKMMRQELSREIDKALRHISPKHNYYTIPPNWGT